MALWGPTPLIFLIFSLRLSMLLPLLLHAALQPAPPACTPYRPVQHMLPTLLGRACICWRMLTNRVQAAPRPVMEQKYLLLLSAALTTNITKISDGPVKAARLSQCSLKLHVGQCVCVCMSSI